jgi:pimeloyl-ACP methyl ester carboxylesterase
MVFSLPHVKVAAISNRDVINSGQISRANPLILFIHGYLDNANSFSSLLPLLGEHPCLAIDLVGHGLSEHRPAGSHYHLADYAYDLFALLDSQGFSDVILVGHSLGGIVSSLYAATQPANLRGFIAIETIGPLSQDEKTTAEQLSKCFESRKKALGPIRQPKDIESLITARLTISDLNADQARTILSRNVHEQDGKLTWVTDKNLRTKSPFRMTESQARNVLDNIVCPRGLILGKSGFAKIKQFLQERVDQFSTVDIVEFDGGHHVHMDSPELVAAQILKWVQVFTKC